MSENSDSCAKNGENGFNSLQSTQISESQEPQNENVLRPILIGDYKYEESPESLLNLTQVIESHSQSPSRIDILVGIIFLLMVEAGFVPSSYTCLDTSFEFDYKRVISLSKNIPQEVLSSNKNYCIKLVLPNLQQFEVKLIIISASDDLVVNCFVKGIGSGHYSALLDPLTYFTSSNTSLRMTKFQHLNVLSRDIKDKIAFPAKYSILKQNGIALPCLEDLPSEIVLIIMRKLPLVDLVKLGEINCKFSILAKGLFKKIGKKMQ